MIRRLLVLFCFLFALTLFADTDCIKLSVSDCNKLKSELQSHITALQSTIATVQEDASNLRQAYDDVSFLLSAARDYAGWINDDLSPWVWNVDDPDLNDALRFSQSNALEIQTAIENFLNGFENEISSFNPNFDAIKDFNSSIDCQACDCDGSGGGGSGGSSSGCPCEDAIRAAIAVLESMNTKLSDIRSYLHNLQDIIANIEQIKDDLSDTKEYLLETYDEKIDNILKAIKAINSPSALLYSDYTNATKFVTKDGGSWSMLSKAASINRPSGAYVFDYSEYAQLNWFSRIEYLLGQIAGIWSPTNSSGVADFDSDSKSKIQEVESDSAWSDDTYDSPKDSILDIFSSVEECVSKINPFSGCFDSSSPPNQITILPDVSVNNELLGNTFPSISLDLTNSGDGSSSYQDILTLAHNIFTFLYFVAFFLVDVFAIYKFVAFLIFVNGWYWKIYHSWVATMFNGGGR